jgi:Zn ribbon nucleic-acid-binding protein
LNDAWISENPAAKPDLDRQEIIANAVIPACRLAVSVNLWKASQTTQLSWAEKNALKQSSAACFETPYSLALNGTRSYEGGTGTAGSAV